MIGLLISHATSVALGVIGVALFLFAIYLLACIMLGELGEYPD